MSADFPNTTEDAVLGGRLTLRQPRRGHRVGHDAILLAAATPAHAGEHAADLGAGIGSAGLALAQRIAGLNMALVEIDDGLMALAQENARLNGLEERVRALCCDVEDLVALTGGGLGAGTLDRVLMNPPFNDAGRSNASPDPRRRLAHVATAGLLERWIATAEFLLKPQGTLTLIWRADALGAVLTALKSAFGSVGVLPVFPRRNEPAIRMLVRAVKGGKGPLRDYAGLVLNDSEHKPTAAAEAVLRGGATLAMAELWP
jgi:tRNA1(Val) A37 N6-methylase TrmN6